MGFRDTIDRLRHARTSRHYRPSDIRTKEEHEESEKKYQKWKNSKRSYRQTNRNHKTALETAFGILDSMSRYNRPVRRGSSTSVDKEAKRRANKRLRYESQERKKIIKEERRNNQGGIVYGYTNNAKFGYDMFRQPKPRKYKKKEYSDKDFFGNVWNF